VNVGPLEILVIVILVLLIMGGRWLPQAGCALGHGLRSLIDGVRGMHSDEPEPPKLREPDQADERER
jgi:Sec-independent protein translocase protein TatA